MFAAVQLQSVIMARTLAGPVHSTELQNFFLRVCGEASPSGHQIITFAQLESDEIGCKFLGLYGRTLREVLPEMAVYNLYSPRAMITREQALINYSRVEPLRLLESIRRHYGRTERVILPEDVQPIIDQSFRQAIPKLSQLMGLSPNFPWAELATK